jgi:hypothetical protein
MGDFQDGRVQHEARDVGRAELKKAAILAVARDGAADGGKMGAELVHAPSFRAEL